MKTTFKTALFNTKELLPVAADVSKAKSNYCCQTAAGYHEVEASNAREDILSTLESYRAIALAEGLPGIVLIVEPTGGYERPLLRAARSAGTAVLYASTEAVKRLQVVQDGTASKSDRKDPRTILVAAQVGGLVRCRELSGLWQALRQMNVHHDRLETELARLKCRARRLIDELFPRLDFCAQWFFGPAATALARLYRFSPYAMREAGFHNAAKRLRAAGVRPLTVGRITSQAVAAAAAELDPDYAESLALELAEVYESLALAASRKAALESRFEAAYDRLLESGEARIQPVPQVLPKARLAMIHGETGPLDDFASVRQLRKYAGMNVRLRESGTMSGRRAMSKKGRCLMRKIVYQTCLPLVRKGELYAEEYHRRKAAGAPGKKALSAIASKYLKMLFGLHRSGSAFDAARVFARAAPAPKAA